MVLLLNFENLEAFFASGLFIYLLLLTSCVALGWYNYTNFKRPYQLLTHLLTFVLISELAGELMVSLIKTNYPAYHIVQLIQIGYYGWIYSILFSKSHHWQFYIAIITLLLLATSLYISLLVQSIFTFPTLSSLLLSLFVTLLALIHFRKMVSYPKTGPITIQPEFWFSTGNLVFFAFTFLVFGFFEYFQESTTSVYSWGYNLIRISNFMFYGCYLVSLVLALKKSNG